MTALPDADFVEFVRARQQRFLRLTALFLGDDALARDRLDRVLVKVAGQWEEFKEEGPDRSVRAVLYRDLITGEDRPRRRTGADPGIVQPVAREVSAVEEEKDDWLDWEEQERARRALLRQAVRAVPPRPRAVLLLQAYEGRSEAETAQILGIAPEQAALDLAAAFDLLRATLPDGDLDPDARTRLVDAVEDVVADDLVDRAWAGAARLRRRQLLTGAAGVAGVLAVGAAVVRLRGEEPVVISPEPIDGDGTSPARRTFPVTMRGLDGVPVDLAPNAAEEIALPAATGPARAGLPVVLGAEANPAPWTDVQIDGGLRAVLLVNGPNGTLRARLLISGGRQLGINELELTALAIGPYLGHRPVAEDRNRVLLLQPDAIHVVDVAQGSMSSISMPGRLTRDGGLIGGGWALGGQYAIVESASETWRVDVAAMTVTAMGDSGYAGRNEIRVTADKPVVVGYNSRGKAVETKSLKAPIEETEGPTLANIEGWAAASVRLSRSAPELLGGRPGILAVQVDTMSGTRILAAGLDAFGSPAQYTVLGWGPRDVVLLASTSIGSVGLGAENLGPRILGWSAITGQLTFIAEVAPTTEGEGGFTGVYALSP